MISQHGLKREAWHIRVCSFTWIAIVVGSGASRTVEATAAVLLGSLVLAHRSYEQPIHHRDFQHIPVIRASYTFPAPLIMFAV